MLNAGCCEWKIDNDDCAARSCSGGSSLSKSQSSPATVNSESMEFNSNLLTPQVSASNDFTNSGFVSFEFVDFNGVTNSL